jgi:hypothetical protein
MWCTSPKYQGLQTIFAPFPSLIAVRGGSAEIPIFQWKIGKYFTFLNIFLDFCVRFLVSLSAMLQHSISPCRIRFSEADFDFVASVLTTDGVKCHLAKLWKDPEGLREILDLKEVFRSLIESPAAIRVSPCFYFYVLVRHTFLQADLTDAVLADYVSGVMAKRVCVDSADPMQDVTRGYTHVADFLNIISPAKGRLKFHLHVAAGNQFLILTGLYPNFLKRRHERGEAPDLDFYESFAQRSFRAASHRKSISADDWSNLFGNLADAMPAARRSLNRLTEEFVFLGD